MMGTLMRVLERRQSPENPGVSFAKVLDILSDGGPTLAGTRISETTAMNLAAVYAAVRWICNQLSMTPLHVYERLERGKDRARNHPIYRVLHDAPNPFMNAQQWVEVGQAHQELWGNFYNEIVRDGRGQIVELWPLLPHKTRAVIMNGEKVFETFLGDGTRKFLARELVFHVPGFGFDGINGVSPIRFMRESLGLTSAAERFGAAFFGQGATVPGVLEYPGELDDDAYERLRKSWAERHQGIENRHRPAILEEGAKYHQIGIAPDDSQFLETRIFQTQEVARWFGIPPHKIQEMSRATFGNIEHQAIESVTDALQPRATRWEKAIDQQLFDERERPRFYAEFLLDNLLRGDMAARAAMYQARFITASISPNRIRELENENPEPGGDQLFVPLNMIPLDMAGENLLGPAPTNQGDEEEDDRALPKQRPALPAPKRQSDMERIRRQILLRTRLRRVHEPTLADVAGRLYKAEVNQIRKQLKDAERQLPDFQRWAEEFYGDDYAAKVSQRFGPVLVAYREALVQAAEEYLGSALQDRTQIERFFDGYLKNFGVRWVASHRGELLKALDDGTIGNLPDRWEDHGAAQFAQREAVKFGEAVTRVAFVAGAIGAFRWITAGESCPLCQSMDGMVVGARQSFVDEGSTINVDGANPFTLPTTVNHPPLHGGCDCVVVPA